MSERSLPPNLAGTAVRNPATRPGSSTPDLPDLLPSLPSAVANKYTPDIKYDATSDPARLGKRGKWMVWKDIGVLTKNQGNVEVITSPLTIAAGLTTFDFQQAPDFFYISIATTNGAAALLKIWLGDPGGFPIGRLNNGGMIKFRANGETKVTLQALAQSIAGTIYAITGPLDDFTIIPGNQP